MSVRIINQTKRLLGSPGGLDLFYIPGQRSPTDDRPEQLLRAALASRQREVVTGYGLHVDRRESELSLHDPQSELEHIAIFPARKSVPVTFKVISAGKGVFRPYIEDDI